jgi:hypothetical protein
MKKEKNHWKILAFDSWAQGARKFSRLVESLSRLGVEIHLVHLGSWGNEKGRPQSEFIDNLHTSDISAYKTHGIDRVLEMERPDAVILLSTLTFAHRAMIRYCRKRNIPTLHMYHGIVGVYPGDKWSFNLSYFKFALTKIGKLFRHTWPCYTKALVDTRAGLREWIRFGTDVLRSGFRQIAHHAADDSRTTKCCVYTNADISHAIKTYGFSKKNVFVVGNPDLIQFDITEDMLGRSVSKKKEKDVMYIENSPIKGKFATTEAFVKHIIETRDAIESQGFHFLFKHKPSSLVRRKGVHEALEKGGIVTVDNASFTSLLKGCCACIVEVTTLAVVPALMGLPLFLANYGKLSTLRFGDVLTSYPRASFLSNLDKFSSLLASSQTSVDSNLVMKWINENSGPLPASKMPERVANVVFDLVQDKKRIPDREHNLPTEQSIMV